MNRTQAVERVDEILDLYNEMYVSGRCPRCEVLLFDPEDRVHPPGTAATKSIVHQGSCELAGCTEELAMLAERFGIVLEPVVLASHQADTWIMSVRRRAE